MVVAASRKRRCRPPRPKSRAPSALRHAPRSGWAIQVGAFEDEAEAKEQLSVGKSKAAALLVKAEAYTERTKGRQDLLPRALRRLRPRSGRGRLQASSSATTSPAWRSRSDRQKRNLRRIQGASVERGATQRPAGASSMAAQKNFLGLVDLGREIGRAALVGVELLHQRAVRRGRCPRRSRPRAHAKDLIGLLLRHFAAPRAAAGPAAASPCACSRQPGSRRSR